MRRQPDRQRTGSFLNTDELNAFEKHLQSAPGYWVLDLLECRYREIPVRLEPDCDTERIGTVNGPDIAEAHTRITVQGQRFANRAGAKCRITTNSPAMMVAA